MLKRAEQEPAARRRTGEAGFSLVELLVVLMLSAVAIGAMMVFNDFQLAALRDQAEQVDLQSTARAVVDLFAREVRTAGIGPTATSAGHCGITEASAHGIRLVLPGNQQVEYRFGSTGIQRRDGGGAAETLVDNVDLQGTQLLYFNATGAQINPTTAALRTAVRRIQIQLSLADGGEQQARVTTNINLRNRFFLSPMSIPNCP